MPRVMIKGVIWNRAQDRVLKTGVLRYGENQWDRIIHLLPGKTGQQCQDRWEIGLKESVKRSKWSMDEDKRLLRLVRIMSVEWHSIAAIMGRTAVACFIRHDYLMNQTKEKEDEGEHDEEVLDAKKVVPGRVYRNPNVKRNCEDPKYIFEGGPETLLSSAYARLANMQARKRKLIARERRLEVARRRAYVRKQRDRLKAKGTVH